MGDDAKKTAVEILLEYQDKVKKEKGKAKPARKKVSVSQSVRGNNNITAGGDVNFTINHTKNTKKPKPKTYAEGTIGANPTLKDAIERLINELGLRRKKRYEKTAFSVIYANMKSEFGIPKKAKWTAIWDWPESRAKELIGYFTGLLDNTVDGRIQKAARRPGYKHTRGQLFEQEKKLLDLLGYTPDSLEVRQWRQQLFGSPSRGNLDDDQFRNWIENIRLQVERVHGTDY